MNTLLCENRSSNGDRQGTEQFIAPAATVLENTDGYTLEVENAWCEQGEPRDVGREQ
jgi:hypothetical protein